MNKDLFRYKLNALTVFIILGYAFMHMRLTAVYKGSALQKLIDFSALLPFGQRLLIPSIAHFLQKVLPLSTGELFFLLEIIVLTLFYFAHYHLLRIEFNAKVATLLNLVFILLLPLISIINYRYTYGHTANFFYPGDSAALFFTAAGMTLCLRTQWRLLYILIFFATLNRESAILIVLLIPVLHWSRRRDYLVQMIIALLVYISTRLLVIYLTHSLSGPIVSWEFGETRLTLYSFNSFWLFAEKNIFLFFLCLGALPLFCFTFYDYIPLQLRPIRYLCLFYFLGLAAVGIFMESRIFHEIAVLLYFPICIALAKWLKQDQVLVQPSWQHYLDRYAMLVILELALIFQGPINQFILRYLLKPSNLPF